jgi:hypothetical protein
MVAGYRNDTPTKGNKRQQSAATDPSVGHDAVGRLVAVVHGHLHTEHVLHRGLFAIPVPRLNDADTFPAGDQEADDASFISLS